MSDPILQRVRAICLALPDTKETPTWGKPHFRVGEKIFAGYGGESGHSLGFKLEKGHAVALIAADPRCTRAPYVGHAGWVSMDLSGPVSWDEVRELLHESYHLIAPKRSLAKLQAQPVSRPRQDAKSGKGPATSTKRTPRRPETARKAGKGPRRPA